MEGPRRTLALAGALGLVVGVASAAGAQAPESSGARHVRPPPAPETHQPELLAEVHIGGVVPLERSDICPGDSLCVLGGGGGIGVEIERRWPMGLGVSVAYDVWFVDSGGVFELGSVQTVRAAVRYVFGYEWQVHPAIQIGAGALVFGDTLSVSTVGGALEVGASAEIELTESVSLTAGAQGWLFTTTPFTTGRDRTMRSEGLGLNAALQLNVGLLIVAEGGHE
jgi:hypothetical protein